jgi:hypothetical protein
MSDEPYPCVSKNNSWNPRYAGWDDVIYS